MEIKLDKFKEFLTPELEGEILKKLAFLKEFEFGEPASVKHLQEDRPYWDSATFFL